MKKISLISVLIMIAAVVFQSCEQVENTPKGKYADGVFITNEGAFQQGNGSVSFYSVQGDTVSNYIFEKANGRTLGDIVQSLTFVDDKAYICVNASNKIEIANAEDFTEIGVIDNVAGVRYLKALNAQKAYASAWGDGGQVKVIDLTINTVTKSINVGNGPENMAIISDKLYVANSGGFTEDNTISVVDTENDNILKTITLDGDNPTDLLVDNNDNLWVLCSGKTIFDANWVPIDHTAAKLIKINTTTDEVGQSVILSQNEHPKNLELSTDKFINFEILLWF
ncbi:MAG: hypothetical protein B6I20_13690 [Bacteroidetes bacterium 4572_117]|nr:MAG: hypothetical protein B6I20_13690 [Bacteroidetes bacterium 4572_117]